MRKRTTKKESIEKIKFLIDVFKGFEDKKEIKETDLRRARITISQILDGLKKEK